MWNRMIKIDRIHSRAITDEIGERLRMAHSLVSPELPPRIQRQLDQLRELDREEVAFDCSFDPRILKKSIRENLGL